MSVDGELEAGTAVSLRVKRRCQVLSECGSGSADISETRAVFGTVLRLECSWGRKPVCAFKELVVEIKIQVRLVLH